ncbi:unnamed protein product, partial [Mesorhabditis spiculigera]
MTRHANLRVVRALLQLSIFCLMLTTALAHSQEEPDVHSLAKRQAFLLPYRNLGVETNLVPQDEKMDDGDEDEAENPEPPEILPDPDPDEENPEPKAVAPARDARDLVEVDSVRTGDGQRIDIALTHR